ncbi:MAG: hypothetical protein AAFN10_27980 [Bacteroidota bacterium]
MHNHILFFVKLTLIGLLALSACQQQGLEPSRCRDGQCRYFIKNDRTITFRLGARERSGLLLTPPGDNRVFVYSYAEKKQKDSDQATYSDLFAFEVDPSLESFRFSNEQLEEIQFSIWSNCDCPENLFAADSGYVSGQRIDENFWEVLIDVSYRKYDFRESLSMKASFEEP